MKHFLRFALLACLFGTSNKMMAQTRYLDEIFTSVTVTDSVVYGKNYHVLYDTIVDLSMTVYQPTGDTATKRPLAILVHGGSFLPKHTNQLAAGDRYDHAVVEIANRLAKRGWVAVSMDYRLGWDPLATDQETKANTIINAAYKGMQDVKACVRFFKSEAADYSLDTNQIMLMGDGAGGYCVLAAAALTDTAEMWLFKFLGSDNKPFVDWHLWGDIDGFNGTYEGMYSYGNHPGHSSNVQLVVNLGGAMADSSWQEPGEVPMIAFHSESDNFTPYGTAVVIVISTGDPVIEVNGSFDFMTQANAIGNQSPLTAFSSKFEAIQGFSNSTSVEGLYGFKGQDANNAANGYAMFDPWGWYDSTDPYYGASAYFNPSNSESRGKTYIDTIMAYLTPRAAVVLGQEEAMDSLGLSSSSVKEIMVKNEGVNLFPNPAIENLTITAKNTNNPMLSIELYDITGNLVQKENNVNALSYTLNRSGLTAGTYMMKIVFNDQIVSKKVVLQ